MKRATGRAGIAVAVAVVALASVMSARAEIIIYADDLSGSTGVSINGAIPDTRPGSETWLCRTSRDTGKGAGFPFEPSGRFGGATGATTDWDANATLPFTPEQGKQYALDVRLTGVSRTSTSYAGQDWLGFGFVGTTHIEGNFTGTSGGAWMKINMAGSNSGVHQVALKNLVDANTTYQNWTASPSFTGNYDLRLILNTTAGAGNWTVSWLAKLPTDGSYTTVYSNLDVLNEGITRVGFSLASHDIGGTIDSMQLSVIPEPATGLLLVAGVIGLGIMRRKLRG